MKQYLYLACVLALFACNGPQNAPTEDDTSVQLSQQDLETLIAQELKVPSPEKLNSVMKYEPKTFGDIDTIEEGGMKALRVGHVYTAQNYRNNKVEQRCQVIVSPKENKVLRIDSIKTLIEWDDIHSKIYYFKESGNDTVPMNASKE